MAIAQRNTVGDTVSPSADWPTGHGAMTDTPETTWQRESFRIHGLIFAVALALLIGVSFFGGGGWFWWLVALLWLVGLVAHGIFVGVFSSSIDDIMGQFDGRLLTRPKPMDVPPLDDLDASDKK